MFGISLSYISLRPCIPNLNSNVCVGTSFSQFSKFNFNVIFCILQKVRNRTKSEYSVNLECLETPVFDPKTSAFASKTGFFDPNLFPNYFCKIFASLKKMDISKKIPNFNNWTIPKLAKTKSLENSVFCRAFTFFQHSTSSFWSFKNVF